MPSADFCIVGHETLRSHQSSRTRCRSPEVSLTAFAAHLPNLQPWPWWANGLRRFGPARPTRIASYSVSVRQVAVLLPRFFQTTPRGYRPCASLALCPTRLGQRTFTSKLSNMLGTPGPMENATDRRFPQVLGRRTDRAAHRLHRPSSFNVLNRRKDSENGKTMQRRLAPDHPITSGPLRAKLDTPSLARRPDIRAMLFVGVYGFF
jgi:hypothetical protein